MARMYSRNKGRSGSTKPVKKTVPTWARKSSEVELLVAKLAKEGKSPSQIGLILRDVYGVPTTKLITNKRVTQILKEKNLLKEIPEDMLALITKAIEIRKHLESNHKDQPAKRGLQLTESKIRRLAKYYKTNKKIAADWKYDPERIKLFVD
ncbi:30S ribosomal protein S15 [Candidatus Woesearchaeota archaeon]|nr:MAG: 30S ribosomal protein S15 [Candidatus Woesearchaeota archaeon]